MTSHRIVRDVPGVVNALQVGKRTYPTREAAMNVIRKMTRIEAAQCRVDPCPA